MLANFMHLVTATTILFKRSMNPERIRLYESSMEDYLDGHLRLYPHLNLTPKHHLSLHVPKFLKRFGPVHGWSSWGFERLNFKFQRTETNGRSSKSPHNHTILSTALLTNTPGQLEKTTLDHFHLERRMRAIMSTGGLLPGTFSPIVERFNTAFRPLGKGSLTVDMAEFSSDSSLHSFRETDERSIATPAPRPLREALRRWVVQQPDISDLIPPTVISYDKKVDISGTTYKPYNVARGDSLILVGTEVDWKPARIHSIFSIEQPTASGKGSITLLSISRFRPLSLHDAVFDNYRAFPYAGGRIYYSEELSQEVIGLREVLSHFAYTPNVCEKISREHFHALPLTRVRSCLCSLFHARY